jgi:TIR domain
MPINLHTIRTAGNKEIPDGTMLQVSLGRLPNTVNIQIQLPGQKVPTNLGDLQIVDGIVYLPLKLVFFSYAREDGVEVQRLADRLWQDGYLCWLDTKNLLPGDNWKARIEDAIERSDYVLAFLSETSVRKVGYVQRELKFALEQQDLRPSGTRYIIPVRINPCDPPRELRHIQWLDNWEANAYEKLKGALRG